MNSNKISRGIVKAIAVLSGIAILLYFLFVIRSVLLYIFIASVIGLIFRPVVVFLANRLRFGRTLASITTLLLVIGLITFIIKTFFPIIVEQSKNISEIDFDRVKQDLNELNIQASEYIGVEKIDIVEAIKRTDFVKNFDTEIVASFMEVFFSNIGDLVVGLFAVLFISFFLLRDDRIVTKTVTSFAAVGKEHKFLIVLEKIKSLLSRYFIGLFLQTMIVSGLYFLMLIYLDVKNPVAIALICGFLNIVPYLGPLIGGAVIVLVVVSNNLGADFSSELLPLLSKVLIGVGLVQLLDNLISQPFIFSQSVKSHPLEIFIVIIIGGLTFGIAGMILAVPVYTTIKVISKEFLSEYKIVKHLTKDL